MVRLINKWEITTEAISFMQLANHSGSTKALLTSSLDHSVVLWTQDQASLLWIEEVSVIVHLKQFFHDCFFTLKFSYFLNMFLVFSFIKTKCHQYILGCISSNFNIYHIKIINYLVIQNLILHLSSTFHTHHERLFLRGRKDSVREWRWWGGWLRSTSSWPNSTLAPSRCGGNSNRCCGCLALWWLFKFGACDLIFFVFVFENSFRYLS